MLIKIQFTNKSIYNYLTLNFQSYTSKQPHSQNFLIACFYVSAGKSSTLEYATRVTPKYGFETKNSTSISPEAYRLHAIPNQFFKNLGAPLGSSI